MKLREQKTKNKCHRNGYKRAEFMAFFSAKKNTAQSPRLCGGILIFVGDMIRGKALVGAYVK